MILAFFVALLVVGLALLGLRQRARHLAARAEAITAARPAGRPLTMGHRLALQGLKDGPVEPLFDSYAIEGERVTLYKGKSPSGFMSLAAWWLLEREAESWEKAAKMAEHSIRVRPPKPAPSRADRCTCGGKAYAPKVVNGALCTSTFHRAQPAPETP